MSERPPYRLPRAVIPEHYRLRFEPDLGAATFTGSASVDVRIDEPTSEFAVNAAELELANARIVLPDGTGVEAKIDYLAEEEQVWLRFGQALEAGPAVFEVDFTGTLNDQLRGFYRSTYTADDGHQEIIATTQFESTDARRAFPCWDEPDLKATFQVTLVVAEDLTALSNGQEISAEATGDGRRAITFAQTMPMSTYLVAFCVGHLELSEPVDVDGIPVRIAHVPGRAHLRALAADMAAHSLRFFHSYFGMPYPADKLDHVALPDFAAGAMENLGLVTYRETSLLVDPERSSKAERERVAVVVAHETAHMWFGDLVTMRWWNGLWLNEAFASLMELLATDAYRPDWDLWTSAGIERSAALGVDGLQSTRPIEFPVGRPAEAEGMFDLLTYHKGCNVLRMMEQYLGPEVFRRGIAVYLDRHRHANTETGDLWDALEEASGQPVRATMDSWIFQGGHPLVRATLAEDGTTLQLSQRRFVYQGDGDDRRWHVPVTVNADGTEVRALFDGPQTTVELPPGAERIVVNQGAWGFYRVAYDDTLWGRILAAYPTLSARERFSLHGDTWALVLAGEAPLERAFDLWERMVDERDPDVWTGVITSLNLLDVIADPSARPALQAFIRRIAGPAHAELGWEPSESEEPRRSQLRARIIGLLGNVGADPQVRQVARERLGRHLAGDGLLAPDVLAVVPQIVAAAGGEEEWELLYGAFKSAASPQDTVRYSESLGAFADEDLLRRALDLFVSSEIRSQDAPFFIGSALGRRTGSRLAWAVIESHWDDFLERFPRSSIPRMLGTLAVVVDPELAGRIGAWLDAHPIPSAERLINQARERQAINVAFGQRVGGQLGAALSARS